MSTEISKAHPARRGPLRIAAVALVAGAALASVLLGAARRRAEGHEAEQRARTLAQGPLVQTARVTVSPANRKVTVSGEVRAFREATIYAKVSGYLKLVRV